MPDTVIYDRKRIVNNVDKGFLYLPIENNST